MRVSAIARFEYLGGGLLTAIGALGLFMVFGAAGTTTLALDTWGNTLHLGLAGWGAVATLRQSARSPRVDTTAMRHS